jgi:hypothetical protein
LVLCVEESTPITNLSALNVMGGSLLFAVKVLASFFRPELSTTRLEILLVAYRELRFKPTSGHPFFTANMQ